MKHLTLPQNYMIARYIYLSDELSKLPVVTKGVHCGEPVFRFRDGNRYLRKRSGGKDGERLNQIYQKRTKFSSCLDEVVSSFIGDIEHISSKYSISFVKDSILDEAFFRKAPSNASPFKNDYRYELNGVKYRSRGELMIAQVLTDMGLEFKYECPIVCGDRCYTADFLIFLPEFKRCFIIEYLGRLDDEDYVLKNSRKIRDYLDKGIYFGRDIAFLCGDLTETPTADQIRIIVCNMLEYITSNHLIQDSIGI